MRSVQSSFQTVSPLFSRRWASKQNSKSNYSSFRHQPLLGRQRTGREIGLLTIECPTVGITVRFPVADNPPAISTGITVGILAERVSFRDSAHTPRPGEQLLAGQIHLVDFGGRWLIRFHQAASPLIFEVYAAPRTIEAFGLVHGKTGVMIGLPESAYSGCPSHSFISRQLSLHAIS